MKGQKLKYNLIIVNLTAEGFYIAPHGCHSCVALIISSLQFPIFHSIPCFLLGLMIVMMMTMITVMANLLICASLADIIICNLKYGHSDMTDFTEHCIFYNKRIYSCPLKLQITHRIEIDWRCFFTIFHKTHILSVFLFAFFFVRGGGKEGGVSLLSIFC